MADERDPKISQRYRELGGEEPSRELDQTILAAAHRAADRQHAPLVTPVGRHRWYFSLAAAAILVLAVAVTVHMERSQPEADDYQLKDGVLQQAPPAPEASVATEVPPASETRRPAARIEPKKKASSPEGLYGFSSEAKSPPQEAPKEFARDAAPAASPPADSAVRRSDRMEERQQGATSVDQTAPAPTRSISDSERREQPPAADAARQAPFMANQMEGARMREAAPEAKPAPAPQARADGRAAAVAVPLTPELFLERIAELRKAGRHDEADKLLAEFKHRYPDYRLSDEMRSKVERK